MMLPTQRSLLLKRMTLSRLLHDRSALHGPLMLMYHSVSPDDSLPAWPWAVSIQRFREQLDFLVDAGYATPTQDELVADPTRWHGRTVTITFDDGYIDNLAAADELYRRGLRATWFVVAGSVGKLPSWPEDGRPAGRLMNANELRGLLELGMEIGSHAVHHVRLPELDDDALATELRDSRSTLTEALGQAPTSLAYPYGAWDARCAQAVRDAGYSSACTTRPGWALRDNDPYRLRRLMVANHDDLGAFTRKLALAGNDPSWSGLVRSVGTRTLVRFSL
jgi:peptidoglycan/xylan/chitin deacetylase (PgdA/CDA1 family)